MNSYQNGWIALASSGWKSGTLWDIAAPEVRNPQEGGDWTDSQPTAGPSILLRGIMMKLIKFLLTAQSSPRCSLPEAGAPSNTLCTALIKCATLKIGMIFLWECETAKNIESKSSVDVNLLCNFTLGKSFPGSGSWDRAHRSDKLGHGRAQALQLVLQI